MGNKRALKAERQVGREALPLQGGLKLFLRWHLILSHPKAFWQTLVQVQDSWGLWPPPTGTWAYRQQRCVFQGDKAISPRGLEAERESGGMNANHHRSLGHTTSPEQGPPRGEAWRREEAAPWLPEQEAPGMRVKPLPHPRHGSYLGKPFASSPCV